jgi:Zn-dependent peptidase ImmA (M78 family)/DNA-binding XRE family transcriptional regulator
MEHNENSGNLSSRSIAEAVSDLPESTDFRELGKRLQHARKRTRKTQQEAADHLGVARTTITAIEKGIRRVQPEELAKLARYYRTHVSEILRPGEPDENFGMQLRAAVAPHETTLADLEGTTFDFQQLCEDYVELERLTNSPLARHYPNQVPVPTMDVEQRAEGVANAERNRLGLGDGPVLHVRELLEQEVGVRVFYLPMPSKVAAMFGYTERLGACMAVNSKHPEERRRQSIMHEYAHFLTTRQRAEVAVYGQFERRPAHERFANAFARSFLLSAAGLTRRFTELKQSKERVTVADLCSLAHYYHVSVEALIRRLEELRLISMGTLDGLREEQFRVREAQQLLGLAERSGSDAMLPARYTYLAVQCYRGGVLSEGRLARFLRVDRVEARRLVAEVSDAAHMAGAGPQSCSGAESDPGDQLA